MRCIICKQDITPADKFRRAKKGPYHKVCLFNVLIDKKLKDNK